MLSMIDEVIGMYILKFSVFINISLGSFPENLNLLLKKISKPSNTINKPNNIRNLLKML